VVSSALNRLRERGLVEYTRRGRLTIDRDGLAAWVDGAPLPVNGGAALRHHRETA
jgi:hypothetical protein